MKSFKTLSGNRPWIWAHRGASAYAPENTMEAFRLAHEMGADGVEIDVYFSRDGQIVICHDEKMDRVSNGQGSVTDYTVEELKVFDFGCKFYGERRGIKIATIDELYAFAHETGLKINVEVKSASPDMPAALIAKAREYDVEDLIYYSSFHHLQLVRLSALDPSVRVAPLYSQVLVNMEDYAEKMGAWAVHPLFTIPMLTIPSLIEDCHKKGVLVNPWTANNENDIRFCVEAGADGIISNYPDRVRAAIEE